MAKVSISIKADEGFEYKSVNINGRKYTNNPVVISNVQDDILISGIVFDEIPLHVIIPDNVNNAIVSVDKSELLRGEDVTISVTPNTNYTFVSININGEEYTSNPVVLNNVQEDVFVNSVTVIENPFTVMLPDNIVNGSINVDKMNPSRGEKVTITATPAENYSLLKITINGNEYVKSPIVLTVAGDIVINSVEFINYIEKSYTVPGNFVFKVPNGVTKVKVAAVSGADYKITTYPKAYYIDKQETKASNFGSFISTTTKAPTLSGTMGVYEREILRGYALKFDAVPNSGDYGKGVNSDAFMQTTGDYTAESMKYLTPPDSFTQGIFNVTPEQEIPIIVGGRNGYVLVAYGDDMQ